MVKHRGGQWMVLKKLKIAQNNLAGACDIQLSMITVQSSVCLVYNLLTLGDFPLVTWSRWRDVAGYSLEVCLLVFAVIFVNDYLQRRLFVVWGTGVYGMNTQEGVCPWADQRSISGVLFYRSWHEFLRQGLLWNLGLAVSASLASSKLPGSPVLAPTHYLWDYRCAWSSPCMPVFHMDAGDSELQSSSCSVSSLIPDPSSRSLIPWLLHNFHVISVSPSAFVLIRFLYPSVG